ncbi:MAG: nuclear transport factor 2 family protein [Acidobacteria bacterium]|nr:nuclear transport factor 2 family protein [Acidobacteriota bacterium]
MLYHGIVNLTEWYDHPAPDRATRIWIKQDGQWKIAHQHYSPMQPVHAGELDR